MAAARWPSRAACWAAALVAALCVSPAATGQGPCDEPCDGAGVGISCTEHAWRLATEDLADEARPHAMAYAQVILDCPSCIDCPFGEAFAPRATSAPTLAAPASASAAPSSMLLPAQQACDRPCDFGGMIATCLAAMTRNAAAKRAKAGGGANAGSAQDLEWEAHDEVAAECASCDMCVPPSLIDPPSAYDAPSTAPQAAGSWSSTSTTTTASKSYEGCRTMCTFAGASSTCENRVAWLLEHGMTGGRHPKVQAYEQVLSDCPVCAGCLFESLRGTLPEAATLTLTTTLPFNCYAGPESSWPPRKRAWCCAARGRGCYQTTRTATYTTTSTVTRTTTVTTSTSTWTTTRTSTTYTSTTTTTTVTSTTRSSTTTTSVTTTTSSTSTTTTTTSATTTITLTSTTWTRTGTKANQCGVGMPESKRAWCCERDDFWCPQDYDCDLAGNDAYGWTRHHRRWCCDRLGVCADASSPRLAYGGRQVEAVGQFLQQGEPFSPALSAIAVVAFLGVAGAALLALVLLGMRWRFRWPPAVAMAWPRLRRPGLQYSRLPSIGPPGLPDEDGDEESDVLLM